MRRKLGFMNLVVVFLLGLGLPIAAHAWSDCSTTITRTPTTCEQCTFCTFYNDKGEERGTIEWCRDCLGGGTV